jgi:hypothetical protein
MPPEMSKIVQEMAHLAVKEPSKKKKNKKK